MAKSGLLLLVVAVMAVCVLMSGCIGTNPAVPTQTPTPTETPSTVPVTTITVEKYGIEIPANEMIRFSVPSNPTTGYGWYVNNASGLVINQTYEAAPGGAEVSGSGGYEIFTITAEKAGTYAFVANYQRPWENAIPVATLNQTLVFTEPVNKTSNQPILSVAFAGKVNPAPGEQVKIVTNGNPTTGYGWVAANTTTLEILNETYVPTPVADDIVGAGGVYEWLVTADQAGTYTFCANYQRPWENDPIGTFWFDITFR